MYKQLSQKRDSHFLYNLFLTTICTTFEKLCFAIVPVKLAITTFCPPVRGPPRISQLFAPLSADCPGDHNFSCSVDALPSRRKSGACDTGARRPRSRTSWTPSSVVVTAIAVVVIAVALKLSYCCCIEVLSLLFHSRGSAEQSRQQRLLETFRRAAYEQCAVHRPFLMPGCHALVVRVSGHLKPSWWTPQPFLRVGPRTQLWRNLFFESWAAHTTLALDTVAALLWLLPESCRGDFFLQLFFLSRSWLSGAWPTIRLVQCEQKVRSTARCSAAHHNAITSANTVDGKSNVCLEQEENRRRILEHTCEYISNMFWIAEQWFQDPSPGPHEKDENKEARETNQNFRKLAHEFISTVEPYIAPDIETSPWSPGKIQFSSVPPATSTSKKVAGRDEELVGNVQVWNSAGHLSNRSTDCA